MESSGSACRRLATASAHVVPVASRPVAAYAASRDAPLRVLVVGCVPAGVLPHFPFMSPCSDLRPELSDAIRPEDVLKRPEEVPHQVGG